MILGLSVLIVALIIVIGVLVFRESKEDKNKTEPYACSAYKLSPDRWWLNGPGFLMNSGFDNLIAAVNHDYYAPPAEVPAPPPTLVISTAPLPAPATSAGSAAALTQQS